MAEDRGLTSAVEAAVEVAGEPWETEAQLPLPAFGEAVVEVVEGVGDRPRGPGRPPGRRNRRTDEWVDYLLSRYPSPLEALARIYTRPVGDLAREIQCKPADALRIQVAAAKELAPYLHQRQPVAVEIDGAGVVQLVIGDLSAAGGGSTDGEDGLLVDVTPEVEDEEKQ